MNQTHDPLPELRRAYLFADMSEEHLRRLVAGMHKVHMVTGDTLYRHGEPAERFFFVRSGLVKLFRLSPEGDEKIIELMHPGQTFAEAVMFMGTNSRYPVNAAAVTDTELYGFDQKGFFGLLRESSEAALGMLASISRRLYTLVNQIESLTLQNATYRLVAYLVEQIPREAQASPQVQLTMPKGVIAAHLAIQPETLSRILAKLRQGGFIEVDGHHITVRDVGALRKLVQLHSGALLTGVEASKDFYLA